MIHLHSEFFVPGKSLLKQFTHLKFDSKTSSSTWKMHKMAK
jgi:hypothetical protein